MWDILVPGACLRAEPWLTPSSGSPGQCPLVRPGACLPVEPWLTLSSGSPGECPPCLFGGLPSSGTLAHTVQWLTRKVSSLFVRGPAFQWNLGSHLPVAHPVSWPFLARSLFWHHPRMKRSFFLGQVSWFFFQVAWPLPTQTRRGRVSKSGWTVAVVLGAYTRRLCPCARSQVGTTSVQWRQTQQTACC
jgi:hypothetical protein